MGCAAAVIGSLVASGLGLSACSSSSSSTTSEATPAACSLLSGTEASGLLGGAAITPTPSGTAYCSYGATVSGAGVTIVVRTDPNPQPGCTDIESCGTQKAAHVTVSGVGADWVPADSLTPTDPTANVLTFIDKGRLVTVTVGTLPNPQTTAERAMSYILTRL